MLTPGAVVMMPGRQKAIEHERAFEYLVCLASKEVSLFLLVSDHDE